MSKLTSYFSNNLEFHIKNKKGICTDRVRLKSILPSIVIGFLLVVLGLYEWLNGFKGGKEIIPVFDVSSYKPLISAWFFDLCFIIVGAGVITSNIMNFLRYNKYIINGSKITIIHRRLFHGKKKLTEDVKNYIGVRFRVEFLQSGLLTKNKYIVELYQKGTNKLVPLYISTSDDNVRRKWKEFAKLFKLPAIIITDDGVKSTEVKNLSKSVASLYKQGLIEDVYDEYERLPRILAYVRKSDKIVIKIKKVIWDAYNIIAWFIIGVTCILLLSAIATIILRHEVSSSIYVLIGVCLAIIVIGTQILFRKEKLVIKRHKIVHTHKYMLFSTKHNQIMKKDIEAIEVTQNPASGRCYVSIISDNNTIAFGSKLPIKALRWIKRFLIHEIVN